jgi:hypothetical protein
MNTTQPADRSKIVSRDVGVQRLVELLAARLDMNRHQPRPPRRRSREEAIAEAASRWTFDYDDDPVDDDQEPR